MAAAGGGGAENCFNAEYVERNGQMIPRCPVCGALGGVAAGNPYLYHYNNCIHVRKPPCHRSVPPEMPTEGGARRRFRRKSRNNRKTRKNRKSRRSTRRN
jgi:hypothetical protein